MNTPVVCQDDSCRPNLELPCRECMGGGTRAVRASLTVACDRPHTIPVTLPNERSYKRQ